MVVQDNGLGSTGIIISACPVTLVELVWPKVEPCLALPIAKANGEVTMETTKAKLLSGEALLMIVSRGTDVLAAATIEVRTYESGQRGLYIPLVGGREMDLWMFRFLDIAKAIAKDHNCSELRGIAVRKGWLRKLKDLGWEEVSTIIKCNVEQ